jgi:hypothetical protein
LLAQDVFQRVNGTERLVFRRDGDDVVGFSTSSAPTNSYTRAKLEDTQLFNLAIILAWAGLFVLAIVTWPISTFARRRDRHPAGQRIASMLVLVSGLIAVYFFYQLAQVLTGPVEEFVIAGIEMVPALLWAPTAFIALLGVQLVYLYRAWVVGFWWLSRRLHYTLLFFAQVGLAWAFWHWNLISPQVLSYLK